MTAPPTKLRLALEDAKEKLRDSIHTHSSSESTPVPQASPKPKRKAQSKLNTLLGKSEVEDGRLSLFQRVGVSQRPTYDLIADRILGPSVGEPASFLDHDATYADHVAERLKKLRRSSLGDNESHLQSEGGEVGMVGVEGDGRPVWSHILDEHRGRSSVVLESELLPVDQNHPLHARNVLEIRGDWPKPMPWSDRLTFRQWFVTDENMRATQACESIVDSPGGHLNPLVVVSEVHAGCSHLLHATGQALLRRQEGAVLSLSAADAVGLNGLENEWQDALSGATALVIDDVHEFGHDAEWAHQLGILLDHALNLGVQIVAGGRTHPDDFPPSRLKEVLRNASAVLLTVPSVASLMAYGSWRCAQRNLLLNDVHLARLARLEPSGWRAMEGRLEQVSIALDAGEVLLKHDDINDIVNGTHRSIDSQRQTLETQRVDDLAATLVSEAIDQVYSTVEPGGIELHSELQPWGEDDYQPPEWDGKEFILKGDRVVDQRVSEIMESITPSQPSVLDVNERDRHLITRNERIGHGDAGRAADILVDLDVAIDTRMNRSTKDTLDSSFELNRLEEQMVQLAQRAVDADIEALIDIADELRTLEERLVELDPEREPLPPIESDVPVKNRRVVGRKSSSTQVQTVEALDDYEPDGEWNIDGIGISAEDLLEDSSEPDYNLVHLGRIYPKNILKGEEE